ncbi:MAG: nucleotidyltransferase family protein [Thermoanaerobaculaceae bacterium]
MLPAGISTDGQRLHLLKRAGLGLIALEELRSISSAFTLAGVPLVVLKGMAYALMFERGGPTRAMADMDLLVRHEDFAKAEELLATLDYDREPEAMMLPERLRHESALTNGRVRVELHRGFASDPRQRVDHTGLMARAVPAGPDCPGVLRLAPEDTVLHHCLHMAEHLYRQGLRPVWELRRLLLLAPPDLDAVARRAEAWGLRRTMWCALRLLELCFPGTLDAATSERFALPAPVQWLLERQVVRPAAARLVDRPFIRRPARIWKWMLLVDRWRDRARYLVWLVPYAWHRVRAVRRGRHAPATPPRT